MTRKNPSDKEQGYYVIGGLFFFILIVMIYGNPGTFGTIFSIIKKLIMYIVLAFTGWFIIEARREERYPIY